MEVNMKSLSIHSIVTSLLIFGVTSGGQTAESDTVKQQGSSAVSTIKPSAKNRGGIYASWLPEQMAARRKQYGLIGPGPQANFPEARFPSYLKKPKSVEEMMPAARAAVMQTGDGQQELNFFFELTGQVADPEAGRDWIKQRDPALYNATWPKTDYPQRLAKLSKDYAKLIDKGLVKYLDKHPQISKVYMGLGAAIKAAGGWDRTLISFS